MIMIMIILNMTIVLILMAMQCIEISRLIMNYDDSHLFRGTSNVRPVDSLRKSGDEHGELRFSF